MAKTTAPTMRHMPPVLRLRAAPTAGPTRGPAAPASTVIVPSLTLLPPSPLINTDTSVDPRSDRCSCGERPSDLQYPNAGRTMGKVIAAITASVDRYTVGPQDGPEHGLGNQGRAPPLLGDGWPVDVRRRAHTGRTGRGGEPRPTSSSTTHRGQASALSSSLADDDSPASDGP